MFARRKNSKTDERPGIYIHTYISWDEAEEARAYLVSRQVDRRCVKKTIE